MEDKRIKSMSNKLVKRMIAGAVRLRSVLGLNIMLFIVGILVLGLGILLRFSYLINIGLLLVSFSTLINHNGRLRLLRL